VHNKRQSLIRRFRIIFINDGGDGDGNGNGNDNNIDTNNNQSKTDCKFADSFVMNATKSLTISR